MEPPGIATHLALRQVYETRLLLEQQILARRLLVLLITLVFEDLNLVCAAEVVARRGRGSRWSRASSNAVVCVRHLGVDCATVADGDVRQFVGRYTRWWQLMSHSDRGGHSIGIVNPLHTKFTWNWVLLTRIFLFSLFSTFQRLFFISFSWKFCD